MVRRGQGYSLTLSQGLFVALYAVALQWHDILRLLGVPIDFRVALFVFVALWGTSVVCGLALNCRWGSLAIAFLSISVVTLSVNMSTYLADLASHSQDIPIWQLLVASVAFAAIAASGLFLAIAARALSARLSGGNRSKHPPHPLTRT